MPAFEIAVMLLVSSLPFLFAYIAFHLWNRYTALGIFFLLLALGFIMVSFGIAMQFADSNQYPALTSLFASLIYVMVTVIIFTIGAFMFDVLPLMLKRFFGGKA
ncbi:MAG: hypothetical protein Sv326_0443 [Candidatus Fermentimicrarchaeum limneticum]|uniref:Uncharacterized protein n=1 Tax=Fermentimicrarchaeum limneticum TaxID=2795018 RepID=A0A7D6BLS2_FERL1|nr:MAG: hypothetical protein Sv326_0369 [Candidatus Fermentimicrarchaeum limneticum]QLJ52581.1 MAG: hypothetical protein Sv326_0406 [Candidatus Fermentimicrarchaeum limneticum]QLJ52618.1 MAG: hypothetical protein Sv326_0443 [Candidatus Fermentimicrarchaeum limneticum]